MGDHEELLRRAIAAEAVAQRAALAGDEHAAAGAFAEAAALYRESWEAAPPRAFGRLVGLLKAAIQAGSGEVEARYVSAQVPEPDSPTSWYAAGLAALIAGDDELASRAADGMRGSSSEAFARAADAMAALASGDSVGYAAAVRAIVEDFEARADHLTGVAYADTAAMFELLADRRGSRAGLSSPLLPAPPAAA